jgi:predicted Zn-dependent peptidase
VKLSKNLKEVDFMSKKISCMWVIVLFLVLWSFGFAQKFEDMEKSVTEYTLSNGLKLIIMERHETPVVSFCTYANVGAVNEVKGITGISHLFEHMAFKGTKTIGAKDYPAEVKAMHQEDSLFNEILKERQKEERANQERLKSLGDEFAKAQEEGGKYVESNEFGTVVSEEGGVGLNAGTSYDQTVYFYNLPSNKLELWMSLESDRFLNPVFREFYKEKDVVMEERRLRTESSPYGKLFEEFLATAYKAHPYGEPVVGHMSDLQSLTRQEAEEYFKEHYFPNNLIIGIVGDVNPKEVIKLAEIYWGRIPRGPEPKPVVTVEPEQMGERRVEVEDKAQPFLVIGYHKPSATHPDDAVFDAITDYLGGGRSSQLYKNLVKEKKIAVASFAFSGMPGSKYPNLFTFLAVPSKDHTNQECEQAIYEEIEKLKTDLITPEDLKAVKTRARANFIRQLESNQGLAIQLTEYQAIRGDWRELFKQLDKINRITAEDIKRVADEYFKKSNRTVAELVTIK